MAVDAMNSRQALSHWANDLRDAATGLRWTVRHRRPKATDPVEAEAVAVARQALAEVDAALSELGAPRHERPARHLRRPLMLRR